MNVKILWRKRKFNFRAIKKHYQKLRFAKRHESNMIKQASFSDKLTLIRQAHEATEENVEAQTNR